jgi:hypothetical protein
LRAAAAGLPVAALNGVAKLSSNAALMTASNGELFFA